LIKKIHEGHAKISELKLRAGYGVTGLNGAVLGNYPWSVSVNPTALIILSATILTAVLLLPYQGLEIKNWSGKLQNS
jgi:hypothetical protein